jgi:hypothetical protein
MNPLECRPKSVFPHEALCGNHSCASPEAVSKENNLVISKVIVEVDKDALAAAQSNLDTYSHCDEGTNCSYKCSTSKASVGSWNISLLLHDQGQDCFNMEHRKGIYSPALKYEWWAANTLQLLTRADKCFWYSTLATGEGTAWKQHGVVKRISKNCSDEVHYGNVERRGSKCFARTQVAGVPCAVGTGNRDLTSECWIDCYYATILGPNSNSSYDRAGGMAAKDLENGWDEAFQKCPAL